MDSIISRSSELASYQRRHQQIMVLIIILFGVLGLRFAHVQLRKGPHFRRLAIGNFVREVELPGDRGLILDSRGVVLAGNRPSYHLWGIPQVLMENPWSLEQVLAVLSLEEPRERRMRHRISSLAQVRPYERVLLRRELSRDQFTLFHTRRRELPGIRVSVTSHRFYPFGETLAHTVGFMNEINAEELRELAPLGYQRSDYIGRKGVERLVERHLRGQGGRERVLVNARGRYPQDRITRWLGADLQGSGESGGDGAEEGGEGGPGAEQEPEEATLMAQGAQPPRPGRNVVLTVDARLQQIIDEEMSEHDSGAVVVLEPYTGRVLASYSKPSFNPNNWSGRLSRQEKEAIDANPFQPMIDKALWSYFPGSVYKHVTALAALEEGVSSADELVECTGRHLFGDRHFHCWFREGHGPLNLRDSLKRSCDIWFYVVAERLGMDTLAEHGRILGFGSRTGLGLNNEAAGLVPTRSWLHENSPIGFQHGLTLSTGIGQGDTLATPLQVAVSYAAIANGGALLVPRIVQHIEDADGRVLEEFPPRERHRLPYREEHLEFVRQSLVAAVNEPGGTAWESRLPHVVVAGKTGTAQVAQLGRVGRTPEEQRRLQNHAWFVGYAPAQAPRMVLTVFLEHAGGGGRYAAPVASRIIDRYFSEIESLHEGEPAWN